MSKDSSVSNCDTDLQLEAPGKSALNSPYLFSPHQNKMDIQACLGQGASIQKKKKKNGTVNLMFGIHEQISNW